MLTLTLEATEFAEEITVRLEHSLVSLSKWEAKTERPFFDMQEKSIDETLDYIDAMVLDEDPPENFRHRLTETHIRTIGEYINSKQTATWFTEHAGNNKPSTEMMTSELIYYWMISFKIPANFETWHLNRLLTLIRICSIKQTPPKKMSRSAQADEMRRLNAERKARMGTNG